MIKLQFQFLFLQVNGDSQFFVTQVGKYRNRKCKPRFKSQYKTLMTGIIVLFGLVLCIVTPATIATEFEASIVYRNGFVYTADDSKPRAQAFAVADKRFIAVGTNSEIDRYIGPGTKVVDLGGKMVMPGIHDAHTHLLDAAFKFGGYSCVLPYPEATPEDIISVLKQCVKNNLVRPGNWVKGSASEHQSSASH